MLRSELNDLFAKFKAAHQRLLSFAAGDSDESPDVNQTQEEYNALKVELLENVSRLSKDQSEYLEKARTVLHTPRFKLQRIRSRSVSQSRAHSQIRTHDDSSFISTSTQSNSSVMEVGKVAEKTVGEVEVEATLPPSTTDECTRQLRLLELKLELEEEMDEMEDEKLVFERQVQEQK